MNPWDFFNTIFVINLPERTDRIAEFKQEAKRIGLFVQNDFNGGFFTFKIINGIKSDNPTKGFNEAQHNALKFAHGNTLILEDDVTFHNIEHLGAALYELPYDWDMLYLGANVVGTDLCSWPEPEFYSMHLKKVTQAWTTHAIAYSKAGLEKILGSWTVDDQMYDDWLRCNLDKLNAFIISPMIADQRPGFSDIWQRDVNYGFFNKWVQ
jgi:GR25 family glycosyltransferase involved in LPS biosynthesis